MSVNQHTNTNQSPNGSLTPFGCIGGLLYIPAISFAIRLGISTYWYIFAESTGINILFGVIATILITVVYLLLFLGIVYFLMTGGDKLWKYVLQIIQNTKRKKNQSIYNQQSSETKRNEEISDAIDLHDHHNAKEKEGKPFTSLKFETESKDRIELLFNSLLTVLLPFYKRGKNENETFYLMIEFERIVSKKIILENNILLDTVRNQLVKQFNEASPDEWVSHYKKSYQILIESFHIKNELDISLIKLSLMKDVDTNDVDFTVLTNLNIPF